MQAIRVLPPPLRGNIFYVYKADPYTLKPRKEDPYSAMY